MRAYFIHYLSIVIYFDILVVSDFASGSPFELASVFFEISPQFFEFFLTFWYINLFQAHLLFFPVPSLESTISTRTPGFLLVSFSSQDMGSLSGWARKYVYEHMHTHTYTYIYIYVSIWKSMSSYIYCQFQSKAIEIILVFSLSIFVISSSWVRNLASIMLNILY